MYAAFAEADLHENALIFYYAPWDADSRATRKVLELIADVFADSDLYIGAVNCWTPKGECFKQVELTIKQSVKVNVKKLRQNDRLYISGNGKCFC